MNIIDRYISVTLIKLTALAVVIFTALFFFITLIDQLDDTGKGSYTILTALQYVLLTMPRVIYELIPVCAVIGSITTLALMSHNSELVILRTSGMSGSRLSISMLKGGSIIILFAVILGEFISPYSEQTAHELQATAKSDSSSLKIGDGIWSKDGNSFINIRSLLPGNELENIFIYEFDENDHLRIATYSQKASYRNGQWILENIRQSIISDDGIQTKNNKLAAWKSLLSPEMLNLVTIKPQYLNIRELIDYIKYLNQNDQNSAEYKQALWSKIISPVTIAFMILIAVPVVNTYSRTRSISQRIFIGCLIGISFHMVNQISGQMGIVYSINSFIAAALPTIILAGITIHLTYRKT